MTTWPKSYYLSFVLYLVLTLLFCSNFFTLSDLGTHAMLEGDPALNAWALEWVSHALLHDPANIFNGNAFYPYENSISLSEHMFSLALFNVPVSFFASNPWTGYNLLIIQAYFFSALGGFYFIRKILGSSLVGFWAGIYWGFLFFRIHHIGHLQILSFQWFPFVALFFIRLKEKPTFLNAIFFTLFFLLQALVSWYLAVILFFMLAILSLSHITRNMYLKKHVTYFILSALCIFAALYPFIKASQEATVNTSLAGRIKTVRMTGDLVHLTDYLTPPKATFLGGKIGENKYWIWEENTLYIGWSAILLSLVAIVAGFNRLITSKRSERHRQNTLRILLFSLMMIFAGYLLSKGYYSGEWGIKLPLYYLSWIIEPLAGIRATQRYSLLIFFGVMVLSSFGLLMMVKKMKKAMASFTVFVICLIYLFEVYPVVLPINPDNKFKYSAIDNFLHDYQKQQNKRLTVIHYPIYYFSQNYAVSEARYMVGSTLHWALIANGFSGELPGSFLKNMAILNNLPSQESLNKLKELKIDIICLNRGLSGQRRSLIVNNIKMNSLGKIFKINSKEYVIDLH